VTLHFKNQPSVLIEYKADIIIISSNVSGSHDIAELLIYEVSNNHSLTVLRQGIGL
jgi:hypothetical protein